MAVTVATLVAKLEADIRDFTRDMDRAKREVAGVDKAAGTAATGGMAKFKTAAKGAVAALGAVEVARRAFNMVQLAVDAEEAAAAFNTTFGPAAADAAEFVEAFANKAGFARHELEQMLAVTGNVVLGLGGTESQAADLSESMAILAGDVASFSNASGGAEAVLRALQSAINGEREALKTYGLAVSEAEVQQRALNATGKTSVDQLSRLDKALATVEVAYEKAGKAVGDLDRTTGSAANQQREIAAKFKEVQTAIGQLLLPAWEKLLQVTSAFLDVTLTLVQAAGKLPQAFSDVAAAVDDAADKIPVLGDGLDAVWSSAKNLIGIFPNTATKTKGVGAAFAELDEETRAAKFAMFNAQNQARDMALRLEELRGRTHESASAFAGLEGAEASFVNHVLNEAIPAAARYEAAQRAANTLIAHQHELMRLAEEATRGLASAQLAAADPAFRIFDAHDRLQGALQRVVELQEENKTGTQAYEEALREAVREQGAYNATLQMFAGDADAAIQAFVAMAQEAGIAEEDISNFESQLRGFADDADDIGLAIINGIIAGVGGLSRKLIASLGADVQHAIAVVKNDILHSSSPSRVTMEELGIPIRDGILLGVDGLDKMLHDVLGSQLTEGIALGMSDGALAIEKAQLTLDRALERIAEAGKKALDGFDFRAAVIAVEDAKRGLIAAIEQTRLEAEAAMQATATALSGAGGGAFDALNVRLREREAAVGVAQAQERLRATREGFNTGDRSFVDVQAADLALVRAISTLIQAQVTAAGGPQSLLPQLGFGATEQQMFLQGFAGELSLSADQIAKFEAAVANLLQQRLNEMVTAARLPTFHGGGVVPGSGPTPIMAMGGETVLPTQGGMTIVVPLTIDGREVARATATYQRDELVQLARRNGTSGIN